MLPPPPLPWRWLSWYRRHGHHIRPGVWKRNDPHVTRTSSTGHRPSIPIFPIPPSLHPLQNLEWPICHSCRFHFRWISSLTGKLWNTAWYIWNIRNHTIHATDGPRKMEIIALIDTRVSLHFNKGTQGLPKICHFLFKKKFTLYSPASCFNYCPS